MIGEEMLSTFMLRKGTSKENILIIIGSLNIIIYTTLLHFFYEESFSLINLSIQFIFFALIFFTRFRYLNAHLNKHSN